MLFFASIFNFVQKAVKHLSNAACQARLDALIGPSMHGMAFIANGDHMDDIGKSISNSFGR